MNKERIIEIIKGIITLLLFNYYYLLKYIPLLFIPANKVNILNSPKISTLLLLFIGLGLLFILLLLYRKDLIKEFKIFKSNIAEKMDVGVTYWGIGLAIMIASNLFLSNVLNSGGAKNETAVQAYINAYPLIMGLDVCIIAPIYEELIFRKGLRSIFSNSYLFVFMSFLIFGLVHVESLATTWVDWLYIIPYGALGGSFALAYKKTDTIYTSMLLHMAHNTMIFLLSITVK